MIEIIIACGVVFFAYKVGILSFFKDKLLKIFTSIFGSVKWVKNNYSENERGKLEIARYNRLRKRQYKLNNEM